MLFVILFSFLALCFAAPTSPLFERQEKVSNVVCTGGEWVIALLLHCEKTDRELHPSLFSKFSALDFHTVNVAQLQICGSIAGSIQKCQGNPTFTTGESGNVRFTITPVENGATINISKGRWERKLYVLPSFILYDSLLS